MARIIEFFLRHHFITNFGLIFVLAAGLFSWFDMRKEEYPDFAWDTVSITTAYPGAAPEQIEQAITLPLEQELASLEYVRRMESTSRRGSSRVNLELRRDVASAELAVAEIQNRVLAVDLPADLEDPPRVRHRKTSQKAIVDVALYFEGKKFLNVEERRELQHQARLLKNRLLRREEISLLELSSYFREEIHVIPRLEDLYAYQLDLNNLRQTLRSAHTNQPLGNMETPHREQVRLDGRLEDVESFARVPLQSSFSGNVVMLKDVADVRYGFEDSYSMVMTNGYESTVMDVVKSSSAGILEALEVVYAEVEDFEKSRDPGLNLKVVLLDDESYNVRNRLSIIGGNTISGFILILLALSLLLSPLTALWVSVGIPFSFLFTLIIANLAGFTINNMTLAGIIIAMGMLVDDAIVVSEHITRLRSRGLSVFEAARRGTKEVLAPITASILTTIAAFLPLLAFEGRLAMFTTTIPPIVALVLLGSLLESTLILPRHLTLPSPRPLYFVLTLGTLPLWEALARRWRRRSENSRAVSGSLRENWFAAIEKRYARLLEILLPWRWLVFGVGTLFVAGSIVLFVFVMNFSLFPREQIDNFFVIGEAPVESKLQNTAKLAEPIVNAVLPHVGKEVIGVRSGVGFRRYRPSDEENVVSVRVEFYDARVDTETATAFIDKIRAGFKDVKGFQKLRVSDVSFGSDSGSALEILVQEDDDHRRNEAAEFLAEKLRQHPDIGYVEVDRPVSQFEYLLKPQRVLMSRLNVDPDQAESTIRAALAGTPLYNYYRDSEEKRVRLRLSSHARENMDYLTRVPVKNRQDYQIPLGNIVKPERRESFAEIRRVNQRRVLPVLADIKRGSDRTALDLADELEREVFPEVMNQFNSTTFIWDGEVMETRETSSFFGVAVTGVLFLIFFILAVQFNSLSRPLIVMTAIVPAWASVIYVFLAHGMTVFGFFTVVGALGLSGIVVNSSILLIVQIDRGFREAGENAPTSIEGIRALVARMASTRLRAVFLTTVTTVLALIPTAYGFLGYDAMLAEMMLTLAWGLIMSMATTLVIVPAFASMELEHRHRQAG